MKRVYWVDWLKFIGIFLVVLGHLPDNEICNGLIYSFHMPLFFIISGFLMNSRELSLKKLIIKDFKALIIPYFLWNSITILCILFFQKENIHLYQNIISIYGNFPVARPSWFLLTLFLAKTIIHLFSLHKTHNNIIFVVIISILLLINLIFIFDFYSIKYSIFMRTIICIPFILSGIYFKRVHSIMNFNYKSYYVLILIPLFILIVLLNRWPNMFLCSVGNSIILFFIEGILGTFILYIICRRISYTPSYIVTISNGTLLILCFHRFFICDPYIKYIYPHISNVPSIFSSIFVSIISLIICYALINISHKYCPILIGKFNKKI